ncbi:torsin-1A-like isoform X1 [Alosa pseudoharengus]|uniref:torsin-1A-like isoform X1 n=2 Tax=Alosa pseudoharengus TaxID=34774 RepID=UPI003F89268A
MKLRSALWLFLNAIMIAKVKPINFPKSYTCQLSSSLTGLPFYTPRECCGQRWISYNKTSLEMALSSKLFGQHLASPIILKTVTRHMENPNSETPLVLSLHGLTGTGKSFVSRLIAESIYHNGMRSKFVHLFITTEHFPHKAHLETYKDQLKQWVKGNVSECPSSMFIFDEMDKMQTDLIDSIKPYLDYHGTIDGVSYGQAIFIFLSNSGGTEIAKKALDFWKTGRNREEINLMDLEKDLTLSVFNNEKNGLWRSSVISEKLVDFYVPFLPLEHKHLVQCGLAEMVARGLKPDQGVVERMAKEYSFFPDEERIFSNQGCKMVSKRLDIYL